MAPIADEFPLTARQWAAIQRQGSAVRRLLGLVESLAGDDCAWISLATRSHIQEQWQQIERLEDDGASLPLYGVPVAVKDNIDVAGMQTTAACPGFAHTAVEDARVVELFRRAGAVVVGKCNLDQFATGLVGVRSPFGAVPNTFDAAFVSGGSSSGSASVVARGLVPLALGTDTAGSGRVPAAFNNLVGLKPTRGALSTRGVVPACRTLDCVSIFALDLEDARLAYDALAQYDARDPFSRPRPPSAPPRPPPARSLRLAVHDAPTWFGDAAQEAAYHRALKQASALGWELVPVGFAGLFEVARLLYEGPWVAERYAAIGDFMKRNGADMDPTVRKVVSRACEFSAVDCFNAEYRRCELARTIERDFASYDAILVPTAPIFPTIAEVAAEPVSKNSILGTYTNFVNLLDWSALAVPGGFRDDGLPFGLTLISGRWQEERLLAIAQQWLSRFPRRLGATSHVVQEAAPLSAPGPALSSSSQSIALAVVGAHLSGLPLNSQLVSMGAVLRRETTTSAAYRLYELASNGSVRKPGLERVGESDGKPIVVEVWDAPAENLGSFVASIPFPLSIGSVELCDGTWVSGFVVQPSGLVDAADITEFGGWKAYLQSQSSESRHPEAHDWSMSSPPFKTILVANRGEIAARIITTLKKLGVRSVAVYSEQDRGTKHVQDADVSFLLEGDSVDQTYLCGDKILDIAKRTGAEAVIPGYGLLSENADFAAACESAGIVWIGPSSDQIRLLGLKHRARELALQAGVPMLTGSGLVQDLPSAVAEAEKIGFPVILKSTAGGGGIGLEKCATVDELEKAFDSVRRLGKSFFKDEGVFIEKFVENARHIEVQIIGDGKGTVRHIGERDCSLQRRHQKVVEESPAVLVPESIRSEMRAAAIRFASKASYRNVGTIEFLYDSSTACFYFLEANTRLQVEHPVTEAVTGLDLVEMMVLVAAEQSIDLFKVQRDEFVSSGVALEARIYAECPLRNFQPSPGVLLEVDFPKNVRVDTWVCAGTKLSTSYDPLIAKIIVHGEDRAVAVTRLCQALDQTTIHGIETNIDYLRHICRTEPFEAGTYTTATLSSFEFQPSALEVLVPGPLTTIQDFPGRQGYWHVGIPPSGPMDSYALRLANRLVGNSENAAGLECAVHGPKLLFHHDATIAVVGSPAELTINRSPAPLMQALKVSTGDVLELGNAQAGLRMYIAIKGGIEVPERFGSRSTFLLGNIGGHLGRELRTGDIVPFDSSCVDGNEEEATAAGDAVIVGQPLYPILDGSWPLRVIPGPHGFPDFFDESSFNSLFGHCIWKVHYNSDRTGIRLSGPAPKWARTDGGKAGLHPSNIHDSPYSIGSISFTGDEAIILTCDGPSLGGFVTFATVITADLWKLGQIKSGDMIQLLPVSLAEATAANEALHHSVRTLSIPGEVPLQGKIIDPILAKVQLRGNRVVYRQSGDTAILIELDTDDFSLRCSFRICNIIRYHQQQPLAGVLELTPGVRSLHVRYDQSFSPSKIIKVIEEALRSITNTTNESVPSRILRLPLAIEHSSTLDAITRYTHTIRSDAPWLPSNINFVQRINNLSPTSPTSTLSSPSLSPSSSSSAPDTEAGAEDVSAIIFSATFIVIGLGDVYLGSPCAIPLDPRHRLFGTKYNPSRSFTPEGTVGLGGQYLCVYAMDSPGGYQMLGRTVPIWDADAALRYGRRGEQGGGADKCGKAPWLFDLFDRVQFYPIQQSVLDDARARGCAGDLVHVVGDGPAATLDLRVYEEWLETNKEDIERVVETRERAIRDSPFLDELLRPWSSDGKEGAVGRADSGVTAGGRGAAGDGDAGAGGNALLAVDSPMTGRCWKCRVAVGEVVRAGDAIVVVESMKMETEIRSPHAGRCVKILVREGDLIEAGSRIALIEPVVVPAASSS